MRKTLRHRAVEPSHPGDILQLGLDEVGISKVALARALGVSRNTLYKLLDKRQGVTAEMAMRLEAVWGGSAQMWLGIQIDHDLWSAQQMLDTSKLKRINTLLSAAE